jgi:hypothetical protein
MRRKITILAVAAIAVIGLARGHAWALGTETPGAGITGTVHDFTGGFAGALPTVPIGQCTFCHTPHGAISTTLLWNHELSGQTYNWDITATTAGTPFPTIVDKTWQGPTAKCLSCHDGTVAIGAINWFDSGHGGGGAWTGSPKVSPYYAAPIINKFASLQGLSNSGAASTLSGVHPVAMPYPFGQVQNTYNAVQTGGAFQPSQWFSPPQGNIRLYMQSGSTVSLGYNGATAWTNPSLSANAGMECSSCHDVHNKLTKDGYLLVGMGTGTGATYLCNMCHNKY